MHRGDVSDLPQVHVGGGKGWAPVYGADPGLRESGPGGLAPVVSMLLKARCR